MADRFVALRGPTESYSDAILRLAPDQIAAEKTYRAIGRFIFEFSQAEYTIRHYLAEEIGLAEEHFVAVVESYDVSVLCTVAKEVFGKSGFPRPELPSPFHLRPTSPSSQASSRNW